LEIDLSKCDNTFLKTYIQSILSIPLNVLVTKYGSGIKNPLIKINLPQDWNLLRSYKLTIVEQIYMDIIQPTLNNNLFANWSIYNKGATGFTRDLISNNKLSFLNRSFNKSTIELHKKKT